MGPNALVFDLDGTLVDSVGDIADALGRALADCRLPPLPEETVRRMVGGGARLLVERAAAALDVGAPAVVERLLTAFLNHYTAAPVVRTTLFPGAREMLLGFRARGVPLGVCTNKPHDLTLAILDGLGVLALFGAVVGATEGIARKPDRAMLDLALERLRAPARGSVMVGDSATDVATARACGVPVIVVSFGYTAVPARELGADAIVDSLADLPQAIDALRTKV